MDSTGGGRDDSLNSSSSEQIDPSTILNKESEYYFDNNAVSLSSAVVSDADERDREITFSNDLLIIAPQVVQKNKNEAGPSRSPSTKTGPADPKLVIPPFSNLRKKNKSPSADRDRKYTNRRSAGHYTDSSSDSSNGHGAGAGTGTGVGGKDRVSKMVPKLSVCSDDELDALLNNGVKGTRKEDKLTYFGFTRKQWLTLVIFGTVNVFATTVISLQAPFYPKEAELKGATATEYGLVFGIFQLTMFFMSPIFGSVIGKKVNPRLVFNVGIFITGTCAILFGFLDYIEDRVTFIALSFALRIIQACGDAAFVTASFTIIALEFPESVATTFAALETCSGVGLIVGPTVGGALYEVGGFLLPFVSMGGLLFTMAVLTYFLLPEVEYTPELKEKGMVPSGSGGFNFISLMRLPAVALAAFSIMVSSSSIGFLAATLEPHLRSNFGLTPLYTGLIFVIDGGVYAISAPIWGRLCDKSSQPKLITLAGCILTFIGFLFIGPAPFIPVETILWLTCVGLVIHGLGVGASLVSAFIQGLQDAVNSGFPDSVSTYGLLSGMWTSSFALGSFIGPSLGGFLLDNFGFRMSSIYVLATQVLVALLVLLFLCFASSTKNTDEPERDRLLRNSSISFNSFNDELKKHQLVPGVSSGKSYGSV